MQRSENHDLIQLNDFQIPFGKTSDHEREGMSYVAFRVWDIASKLVLTHFGTTWKIGWKWVKERIQKGSF